MSERARKPLAAPEPAAGRQQAPDAFSAALDALTAAELERREQLLIRRREATWERARLLHQEVDACQREYYRVHQARLRAAARERKEAAK
jgi:hypothetical protein